jgi:hypothetical protein
VGANRKLLSLIEMVGYEEQRKIIILTMESLALRFVDVCISRVNLCLSAIPSRFIARISVPYRNIQQNVREGLRVLYRSVLVRPT